MTAVVCLILALIAWTCLLLVTLAYEFAFWTACIITFSWGLQDGCLNCLINTMLGFEFSDKTTPFSVFKALQSFSVFIFILLESLLKQRINFLVYYTVGVCFSTISILIVIATFRFTPRKRKEQFDSETKEHEYVPNE